ncbi:MAG: deoxyribonuclease IV [Armatimonadetes bacterium]|nr:deoxyribonuclease IV [Armatimonadota bacterium]
MPLLGAHIPTAGGLFKAPERGKEIGCEAIQLFTKSPNQWSAKPLADEDVVKYRASLKASGIKPVVAHDAYLINLAAPDKSNLKKSRDAFLDELRRCELADIPYLVTHLGSHLGTGEEQGLKRLSESLRWVLGKTKGFKVTILLETTAGQGTGLGYRFEHLRTVMDAVESPDRVGVCLDTCHIFAAGYDIRDKTSYRKTMKEFGAVVGFKSLRCIHANDAKKPLGSRVDRHEHIGQGEIGLEGFRLLVNDPKLRKLPMLLETPEAETMHEVNLRTLRSLRTHPTTTPLSHDLLARDSVALPGNRRGFIVGRVLRTSARK